MKTASPNTASLGLWPGSIRINGTTYALAAVSARFLHEDTSRSGAAVLAWLVFCVVAALFVGPFALLLLFCLLWVGKRQEFVISLCPPGGRPFTAVATQQEWSTIRKYLTP